jgi:hypothetical protein
MTISRKDDHLLTQGVRPSLDLYPQSETEFFSKSEEVDIKFEKSTRGQSTSFVVSERGQNHRFIRVSDQKAKQIAEALAKRVRDQSAAPGSEAALRRSIAEIVAGQPDYSQMSEGLAAATRQQLPQLQPMFQKWGAIQSVTFKGVGPLGADIYNVTFANGSAEFRITMAADGKISGQRMRPLP